VANVDIDSEGFAWIPEDDFLGHFAADIDPVKAKVMYAVQQPLHLSTFDDVMGVPAWKSFPRDIQRNRRHRNLRLGCRPDRSTPPAHRSGRVVTMRTSGRFS
jgi:hypothetical protein